MRRTVTLFVLSGACSVLVLAVLGTRLAGIPPVGALLDPVDGIYRTARMADRPPPSDVPIPGLRGEVQIMWDDRDVPHIFAGDELDAVAALGYAVASKRLFQMDFIPRAAAGTLSEALGRTAIPADRFLRRTGMAWGARKNLDRIRRDSGTELRILESFCSGVNAFIDRLDRADLPFEFRLLGYEPNRCTPLQPILVLQYMNYDLSFRTDDPAYGWLRKRLGDADYRLLYPEHPDYSVPIIPSASRERISTPAGDGNGAPPLPRPVETSDGAGFDFGLGTSRLGALLEGHRPGKGSNNWVLAASRTSTGAPLLAGDMHLSVTLPAIWFEVHIVTPEMNVYGVTIPGAPTPVEGFNEHLGWAFTNTGSDQIDHYLLEMDPTQSLYRLDEEWKELDVVLDTIRINGGDHFVDTLYYSRWGPVVEAGGERIARRWVAHDTSRTLLAVWSMIRSREHDQFQDALRLWDTPMQNIAYADREGRISIRSTGYAPIRRGGTGVGLLDGSTRASEWTGRVPFDELPFAVDPDQGFLTSTNQNPTDSSYAHYLGHEWNAPYRSMRIDSLLRRKDRHGLEDMKRYQADVHAVQRDLFVPLLDTLRGLSVRADSLRRMLGRWNGSTSVDRPEPIVLEYFLHELRRLTWDEGVFEPVRSGPKGEAHSGLMSLPKPEETRLHRLLTHHPRSTWLDIRSTPGVETAGDLLRAALDSTAAALERSYGWRTEAWRWGSRHVIRFYHLIRPLEALGRGPFEFPGYDETLSPSPDTVTTHGASWRVVVDFSTSPPTGYGVYPGGQSGNPFSDFYDRHLEAFVDHRYYVLLNPGKPGELPDARIRARTVVHPSSD